MNPVTLAIGVGATLVIVAVAWWIIGRDKREEKRRNEKPPI